MAVRLRDRCRSRRLQGDTLSILLKDLEEEAPESYVLEKVRDWISMYEQMMAEVGIELPYFRG